MGGGWGRVLLVEGVAWILRTLSSQATAEATANTAKNFLNKQRRNGFFFVVSFNSFA
jgi:hypothetical protein